MGWPPPQNPSWYALILSEFCQHMPTRPAPCVTFRPVVVPLRGLDSHPFFPSHVALGCCFLSAAAAGALAGVVSAFTEPSSWCVGAVLNVAWCAVCASAVPNSWRIEDGMCWLLPGSLDCFCCPRTSDHRPSVACLAVFLCA